MKSSKYQIITLGADEHFCSKVRPTIELRANDLGVDLRHFEFIDRSNFYQKYTNSSPTVCLYFGDSSDLEKDKAILEKLSTDATLIIPVVTSIRLFNSEIPEILRKINGIEFSSDSDSGVLTASILEGLRSMRASRKVFVSYKRDESSGAAIQLYERLEKAGFDVFLDTHSIRPGDVFQDELWHRMADSEIVILLNTPGFMSSEWTKEELAKANQMSIGILQLIWPGHTLERDAEICLPLKLKLSDFYQDNASGPNATLLESTLDTVVEQAESLRARSLAARHDNLISEFVSQGKLFGKKINLHEERILSLEKDNDIIVFIPTIGVPQSLGYNNIEAACKKMTDSQIK